MTVPQESRMNIDIMRVTEGVPLAWLILTGLAVLGNVEVIVRP